LRAENALLLERLGHAEDRANARALLVFDTQIEMLRSVIRDAQMVMSRVGVPLAKLSDTPLLRSLSLPMSTASKMSALVNSPDALKIFLADRSSAGSWASMHLLSTYSSYKPAVEPKDFDVFQILLTQLDQDEWTPLPLSELFLRRIRKVSVTTVKLGKAGHYPLEDPGLQQMADVIIKFVHEIAQ
jgi:pimeloyl-ACP methyl ester carboxylesterase